MNIYDVIVLEKQIDRIASENEGEIPEELLKDLVEAQTKSLDQIENICKYIRHLELGIDTCKSEEQRIKNMRQKAENRIASIKKYLTPYVKEHGKVEAGTFQLSTRKSHSVVIPNNFDVREYMVEKITITPDKNKIKEDLKAGKQIPGASLWTKDNLQIK